MSEQDRIERVFNAWARIEGTCLELSGLMREDEVTVNPIALAETTGLERARWWVKLEALRTADDVERLQREIKEKQAQLDAAQRKAQGG